MHKEIDHNFLPPCIKDTWLKSFLNISRIYARNFQKVHGSARTIYLQTYALKGRILGKSQEPTTRNCFKFPPHATSWRNCKPRFTSAPSDLPILTNNSSGRTKRGTSEGDLLPWSNLLQKNWNPIRSTQEYQNLKEQQIIIKKKKQHTSMHLWVTC